jgi:hypothetical protein
MERIEAKAYKIFKVALWGLLAIGLVACGIGEQAEEVEQDNRPSPEIVTEERSAHFLAPPRGTATATPTVRQVASATPSQTNTVVARSATATTAVTATNTVTMTPTVTLTATPDGSPTATPTATATTINVELRTRQSDPDVLLRIFLDSECYLVDTEVTGRLEMRNFREKTIYLYVRGQIMLSINNSALLPDFPPGEPLSREDFVRLEFDQAHNWFIEDLNLYVLGMGLELPIDMSETIYGLPVGEYWITMAYNNPHNGLTEQRDGTYLIPEAAWRGLAVSREARFVVVEDLADCPAAEE